MSNRIERLGLRLPLMAAPMSIASNVALVSACSRAGIVGCFPTHNAARGGGLASWLSTIRADQQAFADQGGTPAPIAVNINVSRQKPADILAQELADCRAAGISIITSNAGNPAELVKRVHDWGGIVIHDATTVEQAEKAVAADVDGLMLVCAGAGGLGGLLSPFAFVPKVRSFFGGMIQLAGGVADGAGIAAAEILGADMVCMGTRFIATEESGVAAGHKQMLARARMSDILWTENIVGIGANFLKPSLAEHGLDPDHLPALDEKGRPSLPEGLRPWSMLWSGGQSAALIGDVPSVAGLVSRLHEEYRLARRQAD
ncbi:nitronate monooxygenase [Hyphomonas sp.]|uniref:NAD(P)H-dependent flavin oxidoreductase n=1 Tax=Hyphomonas sp. TaxID=87 RepID=UPI0025BED057|nr:nitronate monooxygenase [Hyphomonas sp.]